MNPSAALVRDLGAQLAASEARVRNIIERSPDAFVVVDLHGMIEFANSAAAALFGTPALVGRPFGLPIAAGATSEVDIVNPRGEELVAEMRVVETEWGGAAAHIAVLRDITERSRTVRALRDSEKRLTLAMDAARLGFSDIDLRTGSVTCNDRLFAILGYLPGEVEPRSEVWRRLIHPDDLLPVEQAFENHLRDQTLAFRMEYRLRTKAGNWRWVLSQGEVVERCPDGKALRMISVMEDIDERKGVEEKIQYISQHDPLTGLANRALLYEFAGCVLASARRGNWCSAFLFVDLDHFKPINDTYGHGVGDAVLKEVARRLAAGVRGDDMVGRLGGDEFLALLAHINNEEDAARAARHALHSLNLPYHVDGLVLRVSPSIGVSLFPQDGHSVEELIKHADAAMYHAKEGGRGTIRFFKREFNERVVQAMQLEGRMGKALEQGQFVLLYQPMVDLHTRALVGAEALLRWPAMHALPEQFIAVAETAGFMPTLGQWVMQQVCRQQRAWHDKGLPSFPVSVNVSLSQFRQKHFARDVGDAMQRAGINAADLHIEMAENAVMKNLGEVTSILSSLKELGIKLALDDFGTGHASLSSLSRLPIDILKVDRSIIRDTGRNGAMANAIIVLGQALGLDVIAEGIESSEALAFLQARHCRHGQGFHFCHPLPVDEFEQWCVGKMKK